MTSLRRTIFRAGSSIWRSLPLRIALVFLPLLWIGYIAITGSEKADALEQARSHGDSVAKLFQENTERIVERVDQSLLVARALYARSPASFSLKFWSGQARIASGDVVQLAMIGPDGYMFDTTTDYSGPPLYLGDREHFVNVIRQTEDLLYAAKPVLGRASNRAATLASRLVKAIATPYEINGHPVVIGCSIGIAIVPEHGTRIDEILRNADLALYKAKHSGRNCFSTYSNELKAEADQRNMLEIELREAIWREEIEEPAPLAELNFEPQEAMEEQAVA